MYFSAAPYNMHVLASGSCLDHHALSITTTAEKHQPWIYKQLFGLSQNPPKLSDAAI